MTNIFLGYSTGVFYPSVNKINSILHRLTDLQTNLIEVNVATPSELSQITEDDIKIINKFKTKTIHAPFKDVRYDVSQRDLLRKLYELAKKIDATYILFYLFSIDDFGIVYDELGQLAAFENMDARKNFGNKVEDLETIFSLCPKSGWVCDLNHMYSIDKSMQLSKDFHNHFRDRLVGYHISGYGDESILHTCFYLTHETQILNGIENMTVPLIHEGGNPVDPNFLVNEFEYVSSYISNI